MSKRKRLDPPSEAPEALEVFQSDPTVRYSLDAAARLAGVARQDLLIYCREGLVRGAVRGSKGALEFTEEAIYVARRVAHLRTVHGLDLAWLKTLFDLLDEVEHLRSEVRFWRGL